MTPARRDSRALDRELRFRRQERPQRREWPAEEPRPLPHSNADALVEGIDELLDEIDAVLEEQAVLVNFRQRGGQ